MSNYYTYLTDTGRITSTGYVPYKKGTADYNISLELQTGSDETVVPGEAKELTQYFDLSTNSLKDRPEHNMQVNTKNIDAYDVGVSTLTGAVKGSIISIDRGDGVFGTADGTDVLMSFYYPGAYAIKVEKFPEMPFEVTINAT
jgi:hypothetical protein